MMRWSGLVMAAALMACACSSGGSGADQERGLLTETPDLHDPAVMQGHIVRLIELSDREDSAKAKKVLTGFFNGMKHDAGAIVLADSLVDAYLNDPNSPLRSEDRYIFFMESILDVDTLPEFIRLRAEERLRIARMNRPGMVAADFKFLTPDGKRHSLHGSIDTTTLLVFYDPECSHCSDILRKLAGAPEIDRAIREGELKVLAIYAERKKDVWDKTKKDMPPEWHTGYDVTGVLDNGIYDLPAMPTLYLIGSDRRIILKDPSMLRIQSLVIRD